MFVEQWVKDKNLNAHGTHYLPPMLLGDEHLANMRSLITFSSIKCTHSSTVTHRPCLHMYSWDSALRSSHHSSPIYHFIQQWRIPVELQLQLACFLLCVAERKHPGGLYRETHAFQVSRYATASSSLLIIALDTERWGNFISLSLWGSLFNYCAVWTYKVRSGFWHSLYED